MVFNVKENYFYFDFIYRFLIQNLYQKLLIQYLSKLFPEIKTFHKQILT